MKNLEKFGVKELNSQEISVVTGGDEPAYAFGYYLHFVWDFLTIQYDGDPGICQP